jgi:hypothetical protein
MKQASEKMLQFNPAKQMDVLHKEEKISNSKKHK